MGPPPLAARLGGAAVERASVTADPESPSPQELRRYAAEIFSSIDERPRKLYVEFDVRGACAAEVSVDMCDGEPVFRIGNQRPAKCSLARRWLAEHPVPLVFRGGCAALVMEPTSGNRVRVRLPNLLERAAAHLPRRD